MELKLVYRGLRQVSDWALRFYSEIYVDGQENVPRDGPLIIASCHHNEILDIATLSVTTPHGRPVCFWAKSTMFKNPLVRAILLSSGSIPVARNPNNTPVAAEQPTQPQTSSANEALFRETFKALDREEVIGVFPEGTSYTEPGIAQVKDGASRAALEYVVWAKETKGGQKKKVQIVPVGIVYTDKSQYQSRVCVRWGKPIDVEAFAQEQISKDEASAHEINSRPLIKALSAEVEKRMLDLTINAPDWDTLYAVEAARDILWDDKERIPASHFVWISQNLISLFTDPHAAPSITKAKQSLLRYHSLLYYTNTSHGSLWGILPDPSTRPTRAGALRIFFRQLFITLLHPRFVLFLPTLPLHIPAYVTGLVGDRLLGNPEEEETHAQFKAVLGGVAAAAAYAGVTRFIVQQLIQGTPGVLARVKSPAFLGSALRSIWAAGRWFFLGDNGLSGKARAAVGVFGIFYATSYVLSHWHNYWVDSNYKQLKRLIASWKLLLGTFSPRSSDLHGEQLARYTVPYIPPPNPFIKPRDTSEGTIARASSPRAPAVSSRKLIRPLLEARSEATRSLWSFLVDSKYLRGLVTARMKGEPWMQVGPAT
ncbi:glycerol-3-phosphate-1-acyltransferase [Trametes cingulata]|nr:glycerol-3-phosphate-1-acyltransferase [Trametes cingulata]